MGSRGVGEREWLGIGRGYGVRKMTEAVSQVLCTPAQTSVATSAMLCLGQARQLSKTS